MSRYANNEDDKRGAGVKFLSSTLFRIAFLLRFNIISVLLLVGCSGGMRAISIDLSETIDISYQDGFGVRNVQATSSKGETFTGPLIWIKDAGSAGRYRGTLTGNKGRTLQVVMECNTSKTKCVGNARDNVGVEYLIR